MAIISSLHIYPIKSCRGIDLEEASVGRKGLAANGAGDRQWALIGAGGRVVTQREQPRLALVSPRIAAGRMIVSAPGMAELSIPLGDAGPRGTLVRARIWQDTVNAFDEGDQAAGLLSAFLGVAVRLARFDENEKRASDAAYTKEIEALNRFTDGFPILLVSRASLAELNARWMKGGHRELPMNRFRPNIVIDGIGPYEEDHLEDLTCGEIELKPVKACSRCSIPSVDQASGAAGPAPVEALASYRFDAKLEGAVFGQNVVVARGAGAALRVGQELAEKWRF